MSKNYKLITLGILLNIVFVCQVFAGEASNHVVRLFASPNNTQKLAVVSTPTEFPPGPPIITLASVAPDGSLSKIKEGPESTVRREIHGTYFLADDSTPPLWIDNRFAVFQDEFGMLIVDVQRRQILLRNNFLSCVKIPHENSWIAVEYRAMGRHQEILDDNFHDTLFFIDPYKMADRIDNSTEQDPFNYITRTDVGGIILGEPTLTKSGRGIAALLWKPSGPPEGVVYDAKSGREQDRMQLKAKVPYGPSMLDEEMKDFTPNARAILVQEGLLSK